MSAETECLVLCTIHMFIIVAFLQHMTAACMCVCVHIHVC